MSISWWDIVFVLTCWASMVGLGLSIITAVIIAILRKENWTYAAWAFLFGFIVSWPVFIIMIQTR